MRTLCRHIKSNGQRCRANALNGTPYCFFHIKSDRMHRGDRIDIPPIEDSVSVLFGLNQVMRALNFETVDCKRAGLMLYGLQIASTITARLEKAQTADSAANTVRSIHNVEGQPIDFKEAFYSGAPMLAPEDTACEPPHDCASCEQKDSCEKRPSALQKTNPESPDGDDEPEHNPERAAHQVREELYAAMLQQEKAHPELYKTSLPPIEEFHEYLTLHAAAANAGCPMSPAVGDVGSGCPMSPVFGDMGYDTLNAGCPMSPVFGDMGYDTLNA